MPVRDARRTALGATTRLDEATPTVTLTRTQSGTGALQARVVIAAGSGGLTVGCVAELTNGVQWVVHEGSADQPKPGPEVANPLLRMRSGDLEDAVLVDLRRVADLRRALLYAVADSADAAFPGSLVLTTYGGSAIEVPFDAVPGSVIVLVSFHNVFGELVVRAEADVLPDLASVLRSFGYAIAGAP